MDSEKQQPLLSSGDTCRNDYTNLKQLPLTLNGDVEIKGVGDFCREFYVEFKRLWYLAGPVIFTSLCQYTIGATTQLFAGQLGTIQLAATSVENSIIAGFSYSILYGMGGALETLCGQAYGRGNIEMLGIYLQRAWILLNTAAAVLIFTYIFGVSILHLLGQTATIATAAGSFAIRMIPQLFAYATVIPIIKFLQAQSIILPMALIAVVAAVTHVVLSWLFMMKLGWGLTGAAMVLDGSWWFITLAHFAYVLMGWCGPAWSGFSWKAFNNLTGFLHVSFTSAVMFCLGTWYTMSLVLFAGYFENPEISVDALSVCFNILGWVGTVSTGLNVAVSVRVSNELGYGRPRTAQLAVIAVVVTSLLIGLLSTTLLLVYKKQYPIYFTTSQEVIQLVEELTLLLGGSTIVTSMQNVLSGVAIGAGWQTSVAYLNIVSYIGLGIPLGLLLGFKFDMGVKGIWYGMVSGASTQCCLLLMMVWRTNWNNEVNFAEDRIKQWGGTDIRGKADDEERTS
ncbi:putative multi antimicrobial extrusion protein [Helianthus annuus]|uniref:Protein DETOXIFICATION n=1 Tax=Helianthus annuus TaxID=4232 RepID=A0A251RNN1_HELAN|nr:protein DETOXIFICATION 29 [Helianthus annuus]KAF5754084.1 putative multi antimicrobial extrusion protein [Helianthus annuus]KAJ0428053.1 putative multi antimicrobial extrusion protein [Helianthus annuus]